MRLFRPLPAGIAFWHPATLAATWFGAGLMGVASGTWGSLAALPFAAAIAWVAGPLALIPAAAVAFAVGVWASNHIGRSGEKDSSAIVIDEVAGQWLTLAVVAVDWRYYAIGFLLFRLADIVKPWPASWADRKVPGGLGVMLDDIFAGLYAALALWALSRWLGYGPWFQAAT